MQTALTLLILGLLVGSKLPDIWTTYRHVGVEGELNPLAQRVFRRVGFLKGLLALGLLHAAISLVYSVGAGMALIALPGGLLPLGLLALVGPVVLVAWVQIEAARGNAQGTVRAITRPFARLYRWLALRLA